MGHLMTRLTSLLLPLSLLLVPACDDDGDKSDSGDTAGSTTGDTAGTTTDTTAGTTAGGDGACGDKAAMMCAGADCPFDPMDIDCATACQNIADLCASGDCNVDEACTPANQDVGMCTIGCEGSKTFYCANLVFGCYSANAMCEDVGACVDAQK